MWAKESGRVTASVRVGSVMASVRPEAREVYSAHGVREELGASVRHSSRLSLSASDCAHG